MNRQLCGFTNRGMGVLMSKQKGGKTNKWQIGRYIDEGINRQIHKQLDMREDKWVVILMYEWMSIFMSRYKRRQIDKWVDKWMDGWIYKQMDSGWVDG